MAPRFFPVLVIVAIALVAAFASVFTVSESELAIRRQFGAILGIDYAPGLHWKLPWDQVVKFDRRILSQSYQGDTFLTHDNRALIMDVYAKWRVKDASRFYQSTGGQESTAGQRLADIVKNGIKGVVAQSTLKQIVTAERAAVTGDMFSAASREAADLGIELIDVRVQHIDLPEEVSTQVYESMKQGFAQQANRARAQAESGALRIRASAERERTEIQASAESGAVRTRGVADAQAAQVHARAYSRNPEFYAFYRSLEAYRRTLGQEGDVLVLAPDGEFFKYLKSSSK